MLPATGQGWLDNGPVLLTPDTAPAAEPGETTSRRRSLHLDALRGLAVVCMVVDHVALFAGVDELRWTVGRLAMPLFFILAGHLAGRLSWRWLGIGLAGLVLPVLAPWVDDPNVLGWLALGALVLWILRRLRCSPAVLVVIALALTANHIGPEQMGSSYDGRSLLALMALGALLRRDQLERAGALLGRRARAALAPIGRHALVLYVGHVLLLTWLWS